MPGLTILHGCRTLQLSRGLNALIDEASSAHVSDRKWNAIPSRSDRRFYAVHGLQVGIKKQRRIFLHRVIAGTAHDVFVDHRNGDGLDNRRCNLRIATPRENMQNQRVAVGVSPFKGVSRAGAYWRARIRVNGKLVQLGCHRTQEAAARAYDAAAREHFGEFACTNSDLHGNY